MQQLRKFAAAGVLAVVVALATPAMADTPGTVVTVSPNTGLNPAGQNVNVSGSGFHANAQLVIYQCHTIEPGFERCKELASDTATGSGTLAGRTVTVTQSFTSDEGTTEDCRAFLGCTIYVVEVSVVPASDDHAPISFSLALTPGDAAADFSGDDKSEISVFRPSNGTWYTASPATSVTFGANGDIPVPADYDGDDNIDQAVFRNSSGVWYLRSNTPASIPFGQSGDIPVPADYDGDGDDDVAVFRPSTGVWYIHTPAQAIAFGQNGDIPVPGDYNLDGKAELAVFRPSNGVWYISGPPARSIPFGQNGDIPVPGDYDGDNDTDIAVFRPSTGTWYIQHPAQAIVFGQNGDQPQPADYDGNGTTDIAVFRPSSSVWFVRTPASSPHFGQSGDIPLALPHAIRRFFF